VQRLKLLVLALAGIMANGCQPKPDPSTVSGTIEVDEVHVASRYGGRVEQIHVREGQTLTNGQLIAELDAAELEARFKLATAQLQEFTAGPRPQEIAAAKADWEALVAQLDLARIEAKRALELYAQKTISETERDQTVSRATALERNVKAAQSRFELLQAGTRTEQIDQARARVAEVESQLREMRILAPTNCVLETLAVKVGDVLPAAQEVATLLLVNHRWLRVYVPEPWLGHIRLGETVRLRVDGFAGRDFSGEVEQIGRQAEFTPRNVQTPAERIKQVFGVKIRVKDPELQAGMSADAFFDKIRDSAGPGSP
jgi:HlyD family secretion protein